jgi:hypothetical protein
VESLLPSDASGIETGNFYMLGASLHDGTWTWDDGTCFDYENWGTVRSCRRHVDMERWHVL